ncbi:hypothetical protein FH584_05125 [Leptospira interrogans]|nr:hypothetical protein [Leptospira interrogans]ULG93289.1 hypothetical protein FH584_05125 [Leptospira interrogans]
MDAITQCNLRWTQKYRRNSDPQGGQTRMRVHNPDGHRYILQCQMEIRISSKF